MRSHSTSSPMSRKISGLHSSSLLPFFVKEIETVSLIHRERHYLAGLLLWEVSVALDNPSKTVRTKALTTLKDILVKHELDPRINNPDKRARVAGIYFSFFSIVSPYFDPGFCECVW